MNCLSLQRGFFPRLVLCDWLVLFTLTSPAAINHDRDGDAPGTSYLQCAVPCLKHHPIAPTFPLEHSPGFHNALGMQVTEVHVGEFPYP